jgi:hypothetical protein
MGYCVDAELNVVIPGEKVGEAIKALTALMKGVSEHGSGGSWADGERKEVWFSWVGTEEVLAALRQKNLAKALDAWRYEAEAEEIPDLEKLADLDRTPFSEVRVVYFNGEKWGDDEKLWAALAPFVAEGSSIEWRGEDDAHWRYLFTEGRLVEQHGEIVWR